MLVGMPVRRELPLLDSEPATLGGRQRRCRWRRLVRMRDGAGSLGKPPRFGRLTRSESGFSVYGMETPPTRDFRWRRPSGALPQGLAHALKVRKPAHATLNVAAGEGALRPPSDPPAFRAAEQSADGRGRPRSEPRQRCGRG